MPVGRQKKSLKPISLEPTDEEQAAVTDAVDSLKESNGYRKRPKNPMRPVESLVEHKLKTGELIPILLPGVPAPSLDDEIQSESLKFPTLNTYYVDPAQSKLTTTQMTAIKLLCDFVGPKQSVADVAAAVCVTAQTVYAWHNEILFLTALEEWKRGLFYLVGRSKLYTVYNNELDKAHPGSRVLEQIAKTLGLYSDGDSVNVQVNVNNAGNQTELDSSL